LSRSLELALIFRKIQNKGDILMKIKYAVLITLIITAILFLNSGWTSTSASSAQSQIQGSILYVKPAGTGVTCSSWADPCELNPALYWAEPGDQIWVAAGTYKPDPTGEIDRYLSFQLKNGVAVYGGFPDSGDPTWEQRDWEANETILSGDIGIEGDNSDNSYHVVTGRIVDATAILDGFTITAGNADAGSTPDLLGGGIYNYDSSGPTLSNLIFSNNSATSGGAMYNWLSSPNLTNVTFSGNSATVCGGGMFNNQSSPSLTDVTFSGNTAPCGGGITNYINSQSTLTNVTFVSNSAFQGGAIYNDNSNPTMTSVTLTGNSAQSGGGMFNLYSNPSLGSVIFSANSATIRGGAIYNDDSSPLLTNVTFAGNTAITSGGAMFNEDSFPVLNNVLFSNNTATGDFGSGGGMSNSYSSPTLTNVTFSGNSAVYYGGGMVNDDSSPTMTNITFIGNSAGNGGGMANLFSSTKPVVTSSILWGNTPDQIFNQPLSTVTITYSDIQGGWAGIGNINADPLLGPLADNGGFTLTHALGAGSPAIDAGDPTNCPATDQRGFPRPIDGDGVDGPRCDMGAYEYEVVMQIDFPIYLPMIVR